MKNKMNRLIFKHCLLIWILLSIDYALAQKVTREKKINETFPVNSNTTLSINNEYGKVHINTNDGDEINVEITIKAEASTDITAQNILKTLDVEIERGNEITLKTMRSKSWGGYLDGMIKAIDNKKIKIKDKHTGYQIDYVVSLPKSVPLTVKNSFGEVYLADHQAKLDINIDYGSLKTDRLSGNPDKYIKVSFGSAIFDYIQEADMDISYSSCQLNNAGKITLRNAFSETNIDKIISLDVDNKYGSLVINSAERVNGTSAFSGFKVQNLHEELDIISKSDNDFEIEKVSSGFKLVKIESQFSSTEIGFESGASFSYQVKTQFANLKLAKSGAKITEENKSMNQNSYVGSYGNDSSARVEITSKYGNVVFK